MKTPMILMALVCALVSNMANANPVRFSTKGDERHGLRNRHRLEGIERGFERAHPFGPSRYEAEDWCVDINPILNHAKRMADYEYKRENYTGSVWEMQKGLKRAAEKLSRTVFDRSLTARAVWYGLITADDLLQAAGKNETNIRAAAIFLEEYYKMVHYAYENIDQKFSYGNCFECEEDSIRKYEGSLIRLARNVLNVSLHGSEAGGAPLGSPDAYMYVTAVADGLIYSATVLEHSPFRNSYECVIDDALNLYTDLSSGAYPDAVAAYRDSSERAEDIIGRMKFHSCWEGRFVPIEDESDVDDDSDDGDSGV